jgi:hypothetical protein
MPEKNKEFSENYTIIVVELVTFRLSSPYGNVLVGEAELCLEVFADCDLSKIALSDIIHTRIDILCVYNEKGHDVYAPAVADPALKQLLEQAALEHYVHPPAEPVILPKRISEW